jgi:signal transduction histidine kinase
MTGSPEFARAYASALGDYLNGKGEPALANAYELGRHALAAGVGVLELTVYYQQAIASQLRLSNDGQESARTAERGTRFLLESLSPFEMTHRGFRESNAALRFLNDTLEQRIQDRTAQAEAARSEAEKANRAKSRFLAVMSHELRTPLNAVLGYADLLEAGISGPLTPTQKTQIERIQASAEHLLALIEQILVFAKVENGHEGVSFETVDLAAIVRETAALIEPDAAKRRLEFRLSLPDQPIPFKRMAENCARSS